MTIRQKIRSDVSKVFKREFGYLSTFSFAVSISGLFATVTTTFSYPLYAGGSASAVVRNTEPLYGD